MRGVLEALAEDLRSRGGFDLEEAFIDGTFASAKKGAPVWKDQAGRGDQDYGSGRSSDRSLYGKRHATRGNAGSANAGGKLVFSPHRFPFWTVSSAAPAVDPLRCPKSFPFSNSAQYGRVNNHL
jgi:hypothetical protein